MAGPLGGFIRILDLSERSPASVIAGMVLADLGAEVIRIEPEGGTRCAPWLARACGFVGRRA
jgi:crotonobetainyl-CoA:carnitine CoA-transferase CaiB-like acyl-CoA transferase